jgi:signal peptidase II
MKGRVLYAAVSVFVVAADQLTKWMVRASLDLHEYRPLVSGLLSLSHVRNRGAAFGIGADAELPYQALLFAALSLVALAAIVTYALRLPATSQLPQTALALVLGGALGNLIDRLRLGYVTDFIHVYWKHYQWPDFNVADSAISVGVALLLLDMLRSPGQAADDAGPKGSAGPLGAASAADGAPQL